MERTFVMVKPDGVGRALVGEVISRLERKGLRLAGMKFLQVDGDTAARHYAVHREKPFYEGLITFITSGPVVAMVWEGEGAIETTRRLMGATNPHDADPGTIRGDLAVTIDANVVHGSDSAESAATEIALYFRPEEIVSVRRPEESWIYPRTSS